MSDPTSPSSESSSDVTASPPVEAGPLSTATAFEQRLQQVQADLAQEQPIAGTVAQLQADFRSQLLPLAPALPAQTPIFTEMNRHLRLLSVDVTFLQAARQPATRQQRRDQIDTRLVQLLGFTRALLTALSD